jgi:flagellar motility protein MotE (MotC chaperone)
MRNDGRRARPAIYDGAVRANLIQALAAALALALCASRAEAQQGWDTVVVPSRPAKAVAAPLPNSRSSRREASAKVAQRPLVDSPFWHRPAGEPRHAVPGGSQAAAANRNARYAAQPTGSITPSDGTARSAGGTPAVGADARQYCINIINAAADARLTWQKKSLSEAEQELEKRIAILDEKTTEYRQWLARRDEFSKKAQDYLLNIYSRMKVEAAASQLAAMDEETAAAILFKLEPKNASAILNEFPAAQAARLAAAIHGASKTTPPAQRQTAPPATTEAVAPDKKS